MILPRHDAGDDETNDRQTPRGELVAAAEDAAALLHLADDAPYSGGCLERIVARVEAGPQGCDTRFIVTNLTKGTGMGWVPARSAEATGSSKPDLDIFAKAFEEGLDRGGVSAHTHNPTLQAFSASYRLCAWRGNPPPILRSTAFVESGLS